MKRKLRFVMLAIFVSLVFGVAYADENQNKEVGRYILYNMEMDQKPTLILLDTKTGKVWIYQKALSGTTSSEDKFKGITVEGLAYSLNESKKIEQQINELIAKDLINKDIKGFMETLSGEFSYNLDLDKIKAINYELKLQQHPEKQER